MKTIPRLLFGLLGTLLLLASLAGCSGDSASVTLSRIDVTPADPSIASGTSVMFTAIAVFSDNSKKDVTSTVTWTSSSQAVATISSAGLATGVGGGTSTISATLSGVTGSTTLTVSSAALLAISVTPMTTSIATGTTQQFVATGTFSDNTTQDLTTQVTWSSLPTTFATINSAGLATGVAAGTSTITATFGSGPGAVSGTAALTVTTATLSSIQVTPINPRIAKGTTDQFRATGIFSDNTKQDLTSSATWSSSNMAVATIPSTGGLATGVAAGTATITASIGGKSGSTTLTVTSATIVAMEVEPLTPTIALGTSQQFTATGRFSDNTTQDLTTLVAWSSSKTTVATISNATGSNGLATPMAAGTTTITAAWGGASGSTTLTVTTATLQSIDVEPADLTIPAGVQQAFTATGTFSDGTIQDLTTQVTWSSDTPAVATISNAAGTRGVAATVGAGTATITAALGTISGSTSLTVSNVALVSIQVSPPDPSLPQGLTQQFTATGIYADGSPFDLTPVVTWSATDLTGTNVAAISNDPLSSGLATALNPGTATIAAQLGTISSNTAPGISATLTVTSAALVSIAVTPAAPGIAIGTTQQFVATGTYNDSSTHDITQFVTWTSSAPAFAVISNAANQQGLATGVGVGTSTITATLGSVTGSTTLTVTNATLSSITVTPANSTIATKTTVQFTATGNFNNGTTQDLTRLVVWATSNKNIAAISNSSGTKGLATGVAAGVPVTISATFGGKTGTTGLTVATGTLTGITIQSTSFTIAVGGTQQFQAIGNYGTFTQDLTKQVVWNTGDQKIAASNNGLKSRGLVTGVSVGTTTVSATKPATVINGSASITVQ
ncbi:MAG TPA: Ig-like domain-containing protein [Geobacteraceae bacterium]